MLSGVMAASHQVLSSGEGSVFCCDQILALPSLLKAVKQQRDDEDRKIVDLDEISFLILAKQNI